MTAALVLPALREVRLYGRLGREFGRTFRLAVATPAEAARALCAVLPGFRRAFFGADGRAAYHVFVGRGEQRRSVGAADKDAPAGREEPIRIVPVVAGAKRGGILQTILGVALVVVGLSMGDFGSPFLVELGVSLIIGGVVQMLSPQRAKGDRTENLPSYALDGPVNITEQGGPVPVAFGRVVCGSTVVSQGVSTTQLVAPGSYGPGESPPPEPDVPPWYDDWGGSGGRP